MLAGAFTSFDLLDNQKIRFGDAQDVAIYWDTTSLVFNPLVGETMHIEFAAGATKILGTSVGGGDLLLYSDQVSNPSWIKLKGNSGIEFRGGAASTDFTFLESGNTFMTFNRSVSDYKTDCATGSAMKFWWDTKTTTGNVVGLEIDAFTNLTMGANLGATALKLRAIAPNGAGVSYLLDGYDNGNNQVFYVKEDGGIFMGASKIVHCTKIGAADYNPSILTTDYVIAFTDTAAPRACTISTEDEDSGTVNNPRVLVIKDESMNAGVNNITITLESGGTIDNAANVVIAVSGDSVTLYMDGTNAWVI